MKNKFVGYDARNVPVIEIDPLSFNQIALKQAKCLFLGKVICKILLLLAFVAAIVLWQMWASVRTDLAVKEHATKPHATTIVQPGGDIP